MHPRTILLVAILHGYMNQPEIPFQSHRDQRIKRKSEKGVQEIGQETQQSAREAQPRASNDITVYDVNLSLVKEKKF